MKKKSKLISGGFAAALLLSALVASPANALGTQARSCGSSGGTVTGFSAYSSAYTQVSNPTACGAANIHVTYGTKCGVVSPWIWNYGIVYDNRSRTCNGHHMSDYSVVFTT
jgi:hypothetical protein